MKTLPGYIVDKIKDKIEDGAIFVLERIYVILIALFPKFMDE